MLRISSKIKFQSKGEHLLFHSAYQLIAMIENIDRCVPQSKTRAAANYAECLLSIAGKSGHIIKGRANIMSSAKGARKFCQPSNLWLAAL